MRNPAQIVIAEMTSLKECVVTGISNVSIKEKALASIDTVLKLAEPAALQPDLPEQPAAPTGPVQ